MATNLTAILEAPLVSPPPGVVVQLDNPPNQRTATIVLVTVSICLATLTVAMRTYSRAFITRNFGVPDWSLLLGYGAFLGFCAMCLRSADAAPGVHVWNVRAKDLIQFLYDVRIASILYAPTIFMIKLSILGQYIQVFMPNKHPPALYWTTIATIVVNLAAYVILLGFQIWVCTPMEKSWNILITEGHCLDVLALNVAASSVNVASDTIILLLPQAVIWRLHLPQKQKLGVSIIFLVAVLAIASATIRLYYTVQLAKSDDTSWYTWLTGIWALVEMDFGMIVACMPALPAFIQSVTRPQWLTSSRRLTTRRRLSTNEQKDSGYVRENRNRSNMHQKSTFDTLPLMETMARENV